MARIAGLAPDDSPAYRHLEAVCNETLGFVPNSVLAMMRVPGLAPALAELNGAVMGEGTVDKGFKRLVAHMASRAAGCRYCMAHTAAGAQLHGAGADRLDAIWSYRKSPLFSDAEKAALDLALAAGQLPNAVDDDLFVQLRRHWSEEQILELVAVVSLFGFLNRWNDTLATPLEDHPQAIAQRHLAAHGWTAGKHAATGAASTPPDTPDRRTTP